MSDYGLQIRNGSDEVLIDGESYMPRLVQQKTFTVAKGQDVQGGVLDPGTRVSMSIPTLSNPPLILMHLESGYINVESLGQSGGNYTSLTYITPANQSTKSGTLCVLDTGPWPDIQGSDVHGMEILNSEGNPIYNTQWKTVDLVDAGLTPALNMTEGGEYTVSFSSVSASKTPLIWVGNPAVYGYLPPSATQTVPITLRTFYGDVRKNGDGRWQYFTIAIKAWDVHRRFFDGKQHGWGSWTFPWAVFTLS